MSGFEALGDEDIRDGALARATIESLTRQRDVARAELEASESRLLNVCTRFGVIEQELKEARAELAKWREAAISVVTSPRNVLGLEHCMALDRLAELVKGDK